MPADDSIELLEAFGNEAASAKMVVSTSVSGSSDMAGNVPSTIEGFRLVSFSFF